MTAFETIPVVCVTVSAKDDMKLIRRLNKFEFDEEIYPAVRGGHSGAGSHCGFYSAEDAEKIKQWLLEQGVEHSNEQ